MIKHLKLGTPVQDIATGIKGVLSLLRIQQDLRIAFVSPTPRTPSAQ